jgi:penicillin-binding protein 1A
METLLVKIFATALALSQVTTAPETVATRFDRVTDQAHVAALLRAGCTHIRKAFDIEDINLDDLIATAMDDPQAIGETKAFRGINFTNLLTAYREFCKNEQVPTPAVDLADVIDFYNKALGPPRSQQAQGAEASRSKRGARSQGGALCRGIRGEPAPGLGGARRYSGACAEGIRRGRGQALL